MPLKELTQEDIDNLYSCSQRPGGGWMGAAMTMYRHYENLEKEDEKGKPSAAGSILVVPDDDQAQSNDRCRSRSRSPLKDAAKKMQHDDI